MGSATTSMAIQALVVDDDPMIAGLLVSFLQGRGYAVEQSADGEAALERWRTGTFNLLVTDRNMPRMDGLQLCRAVRALPGKAYTYCIMLTSSREQESLVSAMEAGVDDFVAKPLSLPELGARLHAAERVLTLEAGLAQRNGELAQAYGQLRGDLELARVLQLGHLPPPGVQGRLRFDWRFEASGYVAGDIFDYFPLGDQHLCFYIADVAGHGVAAAMMAFHAQHQLRASSQQMVQALTRPGADLRATALGIMADCNSRFVAMNEANLYLTMLFGLFDQRTGQVALVQAGHPPPLFAAAGEAQFRAIGDGGVPVGILAEPGYEATLLDFAPGSRMVLYSDGVTDCRDAADVPFGQQRLQELLARERQAPLAQAGEVLHQALRAWRGDGAVEDDVSVLALEAC